MIIVNSDNNNLLPKPSTASGSDNSHLPKSKYEIVIDKDLCIGAATCVDLARKTFALDSENKAILVESETEGYDSDEAIIDAARSCPTLAIIIKDKATGEQIFP